MKLHIGHYLILLILLGLFTYGAITLGPFLFFGNTARPSSVKVEKLTDKVNQLAAEGYEHRPGALPLSLQIEELKSNLNSDHFVFAEGQAFAETYIAAKQQAFELARNALSGDKNQPSSPIQTIVSCYMEKKNGVDCYLILAIKNEK